MQTFSTIMWPMSQEIILKRMGAAENDAKKIFSSAFNKEICISSVLFEI